ncbi:MAG TPA: phosphoribosylaminoimidazolesuccinocarboxamide synthase [Myxococcota bacterium]|nr:phosphoribosylaminoimidazolesuccinocarboxamide synthase [Myxococcota bacterium]
MTTVQEIEKAVKGHWQSALFSIENSKVSRRGKVRDIIERGDVLYLINTDRVSAFDHVLGTIPLKGALLCEQAEFWFNFSRGICLNHLVDRPDPQILVCKKAQALPIEVIVRGYLAGSLMREKPEVRGHSYGLKLDPNLKNYQALETPIITPTTKAPQGAHDEPISRAEIIGRNLVQEHHWQEIEDIALALFNSCANQARKSGLLLVDTKYEFGLINDKIHLIDEVHTSDSSRFFMEADYQEKFPINATPTMLDKEYLRQRLIENGVNPNTSDALDITLDEELRIEVAKRYFMLTEKITGRTFNAPSLGAKTRVHEAILRLCPFHSTNH